MAESEFDQAQALMDVLDEQGADAYTEAFDLAPWPVQDQAHAMLVAKNAKRTAYMDQLIAAAGGDLNMTWAEAAARLRRGPR